MQQSLRQQHRLQAHGSRPHYRRRPLCLVRLDAFTPCCAAQSESAANAGVPSIAASAEQPLPASLRVSRRIAASRAAESRRVRGDGEEALFLDPYAELLARWPGVQVTATPDAAASSAGSSPSSSTTTSSSIPAHNSPASSSPGTACSSSSISTSAPPSAGAAAWDAATGHDVVCTAHLDRLLLAATSVAAVNRITQGDYRQVVLVGDAMDTRPFRLPWPPGTAIYMVAPREAHAAAEAALGSQAAADIAASLLAEAPTATAALAQAEELQPASPAHAAEAEVAQPSSSGRGGDGETEAAVAAAAGRARGRKGVRRPPGPRPPPGCLLRRIAIDFEGGGASLPSALAAAGFRADRLSVWAIQGLEGLELGPQDVEGVLSGAALSAAYASLLLGELPACLGGRAEAENALADCGLLGAPLAFGGPDTTYGVWRPQWGPPPDPAAPQRWLFAAQQVRLSGAQMDTYAAHREAAEELDEDFFDNFS